MDFLFLALSSDGFHGPCQGTGAHDCTLIVRTLSVEDFENLLMKHLLGHPSFATASSNIALRQQKRTAVLPI